MNPKQGVLDRMAERLMGGERPGYGDERERAVFMEASTFGSGIAIYAGLLTALVAALLGQLLLPVVVVVLTSLPTWFTTWYAARRGVDVHALASGAGARAKALTLAAVVGGLVLILAAMLYAVSAGQGVVPVAPVEPPSGILGSLLRGGLVGGMIGALLALVLMVRASRRAPTTTIDTMDTADDA